ncbi:GRAM domain, partial [Trinorchestia longiramus]
LTSAFKTGRLYLTTSFLCFERSRSIRTKNITLPLINVAQVVKAESYSWIPGGGMAIEVCMKPDTKFQEDNGHSPLSSGGEDE